MISINFATSLALLGSLLAVQATAQTSRPNVIVFFTDDHGHADLSCQGVLNDIKTPNVDALARSGVRVLNGYSTAPQCVPSRAGLLVGKFQSRFGVESNGSSLEGFDRELTIAERLKASGYVTAQFGKWHLGPGPKIVDHGFQHVFAQNSKAPFSANITLDGRDRKMANLAPEMYHVDGCSRAAASIIDRYSDTPFFLYIAYRAPHVPLDAPQKYLDRFPGTMPERRRQALAMISAVDDGVGLITDTLAKHGLIEKTLIFYIGDNGAPLKIHKADIPGSGAGWDGSLNDPLNGEKGMLSEGGMHVPFVVCWPGTIPGGQVYQYPVSSLDVSATAVALANVETAKGDLDGVNLIPYLTGKNSKSPHHVLMWRWTSQSAIRDGNWKLLRGGTREYLFDLDTDLEEKHNLAATHPEIANQLRSKLISWAGELRPPGLSNASLPKVSSDYFDFYLDGKPAPPLRSKFVAGSTVDDPGTKSKPMLLNGWTARSGLLDVAEGSLRVVASGKAKSKAPILVRTGLRLAGPMTAKIKIRSTVAGSGSLAWRVKGQKEFKPECKRLFIISDSEDWETHEIELPVEGELIHLRIVLPNGTTLVRELELQSGEGKPFKLWE